VTLEFWLAYFLGAGIAALTIGSLIWLMRDPKGDGVE
jgi:hypothetical protein